MTRPRFGRWHLAIAGVVVAALAAASIVWVASRGSDDTDGAAGGPAANVIDLVPPPSGMVVGLERLGIGNSAVPEGTRLSLVVAVAAQAPLAAVELWAGGALAERRDLTAPGPGSGSTTAIRQAFDWTAPAGDIVLTARAIDTAGRTALSNAIRVRAGGPPRLSTIVDYTVVEGDTPESIATAHGTSPQLLALANPGAFQPGESPVGTTIQIPVEVVFPVGEDASGGPSRPARTPAAPPPFDLVVEGCTASVPPPADTAGIAGMAAFVLPPDGEMFELLASVPVTDTLTFPVPAGTSMLVVGTFADGVQTLGPPQPVAPTTDCADGWTGDVHLAGSRLVGSAGATPDADLAYLYVSTGGGWERVPPAGFVDRSADGFDFAGLLPEPISDEIDIEAWGRKGGGLVSLGKGSYRAGSGALPASPQHLRTQLWWIKTPGTGGAAEVLATKGFVPTPGQLRFRWKASSPFVTKAAWQVTSYLVPATAGLDIPGVIAEGFLGGSEPVFEIDFSTFTGKAPLSTAAASAALGPMAAVGGPITGPVPGATPDTPVTVPAAVVVGANGPQLAGGAQVVGDAVQPAIPEPSRFYVRLVPFVGEQFAGRASNMVVIDTKFDPSAIGELGPIDVLPGPNVYDLDVQVTAPIPPIPWYSKCWRITEIDPAKFDPLQAGQNAGWQAFVSKVGNVVCPICYKAGNWQFDYAGLYGWHCANDDGFDLGDPGTWDEFPILGPLLSKLIQSTTSAWDFVVELAMYLKAKVVDLVAFVGCEGFVKVAGNKTGTVNAQQAEDWCHSLAEIAVDVVLIAYGIPPTLPKFEQAIQLAKGEIAAVIAELATDIGIPCEEAATAGQVIGDETLTCEALAKALIDHIVNTAKAAVSASASAVSGIYFPPGVYAVPHEAGQVTPGSVTIEVSPTAGAPVTGLTCPATVVMSSSYTAPDTAFGSSKFPELNIGFATNYGAGNGMWVKAGQYGGFVIEPTTVALPTLATGASPPPVAKPYTLGQLASHDPVQGHTYLGTGADAIALHPQVPYASLQLHPGATLTTSVHAACAGDVMVIGTILGGGKVQVTKVIS